MGEAARRRQEIFAWRGTLSQEELVIADVSMALFDKFIRPMGYTGGCYHMAFWLTEYLRTRRNVIVTPIIGFVNDGTDDIMISHAWIEINSKKTDVTLAVTDRQRSGSLLILDRAISRGDCSYSYHTIEPDASRQASERLGVIDPRWKAAMGEKDAEHVQMSNVASDPTLIRKYLDSAPTELSFDAIIRFLE
jgi:hypothetical protein